jgi:hypothetical protein
MLDTTPATTEITKLIDGVTEGELVALVVAAVPGYHSGRAADSPAGGDRQGRAARAAASLSG